MSDFVIKQLPYELSSQAGLALVGKYLAHINLNALVDPAFPVRSGVANSAIIKSYLALLCQGKSDFDAIETMPLCARTAPGRSAAVPSSPTLRQRLDTHASAWFELASVVNETLLASRIEGRRVDFGALPCGYTPLDIDTYLCHGQQWHQEGAGWPHLRRSRWLLPHRLPIWAPQATAWSWPCARVCSIRHARPNMTWSGGCCPWPRAWCPGRCWCEPIRAFAPSKALMRTIAEQGRLLERDVAFLIKWNPRSTSVEAIARQKVDDASILWCQPRAGKRLCVWEEIISMEGGGVSTNTLPDADEVSEDERFVVRRIYRLTERTIDRHCQPMLLPEYILQGWTTTLPAKLGAGAVIALYADHATHEQYHSEFKTDLDLERLPSGKFDTNYLICQLAAVAMNLLRLIGQHTFLGKDAPIRHKAKRRRIKKGSNTRRDNLNRLPFRLNMYVLRRFLGVTK